MYCFLGAQKEDSGPSKFQNSRLESDIFPDEYHGYQKKTEGMLGT